ncbi:diamine N-acetyltransferase [Klebsormidium nitens]|uniref:Diamine N-acetyltransferase n=1 Tax=Klebsormidium nitens TaxID=105231 RepID=A0A1Y1I2L9_KLENI|nr:diamine N-acetyltransferase [Klebsormidium nitens]|eukprot:GAQ85175.1 diamine N-acetyltransferase [Klebsormidium nitens]
MPLRAAVEADLDDIISLIKALAEYEKLLHEVVLKREVMREHLFGPNPAAKVLLAETDDHKVAGFALYFTTFSTFLGRPGIWLEDLFVLPEYRKHGYGKALIQELRRLTDGRVEWAVLDWNEPSIKFYESLGAKRLEGWGTFRWDPAPSAEASSS